ncbi:3-dehydroquinate synthase II [Variovorax paradoxus]|uniref:3-dehydroquinate synthase II n=1 Tax=Variovorax paradoxus TaxID=34073 RepID=UPI001ABD3AFE
MKASVNALASSAGGAPSPLRVVDGRSPACEDFGAGASAWWFDARGLDDSALKQAVERSSCTHLLVEHAEQKRVGTSKKLVVWVEHASELIDLAPGAWVLTPHEEIRREAVASGRAAGLFIEVRDLEAEFPYCVMVCERGDDFVVINIEHATYIPYELLIAKTRSGKTQVLRSVPIKGLARVVDDIHQSLNAFATMEHGIGVVFRTKEVAAVESLSRNLQHRQVSAMKLLPARVDEVQHTGLGHRVCVDTTSMMNAEEGMVIGSTGWGGILVCSETHHLPHMNLREFRVNAGAVHSYIWGPGGTAFYLSEMRAGAEVMCVDLAGRARVVSVGRAKIERRPMLKVNCSIALEAVPAQLQAKVERLLEMQERVTPKGEHIGSGDRRIHVNAFLQNDWHVRVMGSDGKARHCTLLQPGDELLAHVDDPGRHTGLRIEENIIEK